MPGLRLVMRPASLLLVLLACGRTTPAVPDDAAPADSRLLGWIDGECDGIAGAPRVLVYTYENQWRHLSNYYARAALLGMCQTYGFHVESTNDPHAINAVQLARFDVVVFAVTSGSGIDGAGKRDFEAWVRAGGGVVGFEAATSTEQDWPFYVANMGAAFAGHAPAIVQGTVDIAQDHPITQGLPATLTLVDQWYVFDPRPETVPGLHVLMTLDESSLPGDFPDAYKRGYHALGWAHENLGGRVFYTALGDQPDDFSDPTILELARRAIEWAAHRR